MADVMDVLNYKSYNHFTQALMNRIYALHCEIPERLLQSTVSELKAQWDLDEELRIDSLKHKLVAFSSSRLNSTRDASSVAVARATLKGILVYSQNNAFNPWRDNVPIIAYVYHPACGFLVIKYEDMGVAMFHATGQTHKKLDSLAPGRKYIIVAIHGGSSEGALNTGMGFACAEFSEGSPTEHVLDDIVLGPCPDLNTSPIGDPDAPPGEQGGEVSPPLSLTGEAESDQTRSLDYFFARLFPIALMRLFEYKDTITTRAIDNRIDVLFNELPAVRAQLSNCRALNAKLMSKQAELAKQNGERVTEVLKLKTLEVRHQQMLDYLLAHGMFECYTEGRSPHAAYKKTIARGEKQRALSQCKIESLQAELIDANYQLTQQQHVHGAYREEVTVELLELRGSRKTDLHAFKGTLSAIRSELDEAETQITMGTEIRARLQERNAETAQALRVSDQIRSRLQADVLAHQAEITDLKVQLESCTDRPRKGDSTPAEDEKGLCGSAVPRQTEQCLILEITSMYGSHFARHVEHNSFGNFIHKQHKVEQACAAKRAARDLAYLCWARDPSTLKNDMTWEETKMRFSTLSQHELDAKLREIFKIPLDELMLYIHEKYC